MLGLGRGSLPATITARDYDGSASHVRRVLRGCDSTRWNIAACQRPYESLLPCTAPIRVFYVPPSRCDCNVDATRLTASRHSSCLGLTAVSSSSAHPDGNLMAYSPRTFACSLSDSRDRNSNAESSRRCSC